MKALNEMPDGKPAPHRLGQRHTSSPSLSADKAEQWNTPGQPIAGLDPMGAPGLICPHCERALSEHERPCTGITRRHLFFGLFAGAAAGMAIPDVWGIPENMPFGWSKVPLNALVFRADRMPFEVTEYPVVDARPYIAYTVIFQEIWNYFPLGALRIVRNPVVPFWRRAR